MSEAKKEKKCNLCDAGFPLNEAGDHLPTQRLGMIQVTRCKKLPPTGESPAPVESATRQGQATLLKQIRELELSLVVSEQRYARLLAKKITQPETFTDERGQVWEELHSSLTKSEEEWIADLAERIIDAKINVKSVSIRAESIRVIKPIILSALRDARAAQGDTPQDVRPAIFDPEHYPEDKQSVCEHVYSRSMDQPYPRLCIKCGKAEAQTTMDDVTRQGLEAALTVANVRGELPPDRDCPWLGFADKAGSLIYATQVYEWMEREFGVGHFCLCDDEGWWYVEERAQRAALTSTPSTQPRESSAGGEAEIPRTPRTESGEADSSFPPDGNNNSQWIDPDFKE